MLDSNHITLTPDQKRLKALTQHVTLKEIISHSDFSKVTQDMLINIKRKEYNRLKRLTTQESKKRTLKRTQPVLELTAQAINLRTSLENLKKDKKSQ